jgi:hypothetical protein
MAQDTKNTLKNVNAPETASEAHTDGERGRLYQVRNLPLRSSERWRGPDGPSESGFHGRYSPEARSGRRRRQAVRRGALQGSRKLAASAATRLFLARKAGTISGDELSGLLGDIFGYKPKADGTPGKHTRWSRCNDQNANRSRASGLGFRQRRRRWPLLRDDGRG